MRPITPELEQQDLGSCIVTLDDGQIRSAAHQLDEAERCRRQIRMLTIDHPGMTMADAYRIQAAWIDCKLRTGRRIIGHKVGLTSKAMQSALGIDQPDSGILLDDMVFQNGGSVPTDRFISLRVEAELAFVIGSALEGPNCTIFDVLNATDCVVPALEILDTRIFRKDEHTGTTRTVRDTIADNAANAGIIWGGRPFRAHEQNMAWIGAICSKNGGVEETGLAAGVLNHPANGIAWLVKSRAIHGDGLKPGQIVLSGSFVRPIEVTHGDTVQADFGQFGIVSAHFR